MFTEAGHAVLAKHRYTSEPESKIPPWFWLQVSPLVSLNDGLGPKSMKRNQPVPPLSCFPSNRIELEQVGKEEGEGKRGRMGGHHRQSTT